MNEIIKSNQESADEQVAQGDYQAVITTMEIITRPKECLELLHEPKRFTSSIGSGMRNRNSLMADALVFGAVVHILDAKEDLQVGPVPSDKQPIQMRANVPCQVVVRTKMILTEGDRMIELQSMAEVRALHAYLDKVIECAEKTGKSLKRTCDYL